VGGVTKRIHIHTLFFLLRAKGSASGDIRYLRPFIVGLFLPRRFAATFVPSQEQIAVVNSPGHESSGYSTSTHAVIKVARFDTSDPSSLATTGSPPVFLGKLEL